MRAVNWTFTYHGAPSGTILADEIIRDLSPHMGSELCTAVETAYSLSYLYQALGDSYYADRSELAIFNALPVMLTADIWAHQYMDQVNQPWATNDSHGIFTTSNSGVATSFGLEPEYPCCTVNFPQGYPKFLTNSWAQTPSGLVHMLLSPSTVTTNISGHQVTIQCGTDYPFDNTLTYTVDAETPFNLRLRIPSWSSKNIIIVNGAREAVYPQSTTNTQTITLPAGHSTVILQLELAPRTETRSGTGGVAVYVGNLLYGLDVGQATTSTLPHAYTNPQGAGMDDIPYPQARDYYLANTTPWNVAIDPSTMDYHGLPPATATAANGAATLDRGVFDYEHTPTYITVKGCQVDWGLFNNRTPEDRPDTGACVDGTAATFHLIPYGAGKLHMAEMPTVDLSAGATGRSRALVVNAKTRPTPTWRPGAETSRGPDAGPGSSVSSMRPPMQSVFTA
jgi:hypothetical protein